MKIISQYVQLEDKIDRENILKKIEKAGRTCYKSENNVKEGSAKTFIKNIVKRGHESVIEHVSISVRIVTDRATTHELVRHRIASYSQESTRYCDFSKDKFGNELTFIQPIIEERHAIHNKEYMDNWKKCMQQIEDTYLNMRDKGIIPEYSRQILPNSLKTEIVVTMNLRAWRHFFKLRIHKSAHPQIRDIANKIFKIFNKELPEIFSDLEEIKAEKELPVKKYEILKDDFIEYENKRMYRIKALVNFSDVRAGDLGGYIEKEDNLSHRGYCWVYDNAAVNDNARVSENAKIYDYARIYHNAEVSGNAIIENTVQIFNNAKVYGNAAVRHEVNVYEYAEICGTASIGGNFRIHGNVKLDKYARVNGAYKHIC